MIPIAFDVLGTCYSLDAASEAIQMAFGQQALARANVNPAFVNMIVEDWFHTSQRDFTYTSMNGHYIPIFQIFKANLPKVLEIAKLSPPEAARVSPDASTPPYSTSVFSDEFLQPILTTLTAMTPRPSLAGCSKLLTETNKFTLLAATNGGAASTRGLFERALGKEMGGEGGPWGVFSCDEHQVAKPAPAVYEQIWRRFEEEGLTERKGWFIASHTWDLFAAKRAGFKTAWVAYEEFITCESVYGRPDVVAVDLEDAARQIIALEK